MITSKQVEKIRNAIHEQVNEIHKQVDKQLDDLVRRFHENKSVRRLMVDILHDKEGGVCGGCGETFQARNMELDHIVPKSSGGSYCIDNRQVLCGACNREKGKMPMEEFLKKGGHSNVKTNIRMSGSKDWEFMEAIVLENKPNSMSASEVANVCLKKKLWRGSGRKIPKFPAAGVQTALRRACGLKSREETPISEEAFINAKIKEIVVDGKLCYVAK